jgi:transglutaminase-like putative cysteine protease
MYDTNSENYKIYTAERKPHIVFSDQIKQLTTEVTSGISNPLEKVKAIFYWIDNNTTWASALEYSTIECIPEYVLNNRHGDCGMKTLLFMSMARYAGIPCKWQSGWMLHPGELNLHDWCEVYYEGIGWVPLDQSFGLQNSENQQVKDFYISGIDEYRLIVNDDFSSEFEPGKQFFRSEPIDFQRGELEWKGGNIYFNRWNYHVDITYLN